MMMKHKAFYAVHIKLTYLFTLLCFSLLCLTACGGKDKPRRQEPDPVKPGIDPNEGGKAPVWNKDRTIGLLFVGKLDGSQLYDSTRGYEVLGEKMRSMDKKAYSFALVDGADMIQEGGQVSNPAMAIQPKLLGDYGYLNLHNYSDGVAQGALLFAPQWQDKKVEQVKVGDNGYILMTELSFKSSSVAQIQYDLHIATLHLSTAIDISGFKSHLPNLTSLPHQYFIIGIVEAKQKEALKNATSGVSGYELTFPSGLPNSKELLFIFAPTSFLHRETKELFALEGNVKGYLISIESGVKR